MAPYREYHVCYVTCVVKIVVDAVCTRIIEAILDDRYCDGAAQGGKSLLVNIISLIRTNMCVLTW